MKSRCDRCQWHGEIYFVEDYCGSRGTGCGQGDYGESCKNWISPQTPVFDKDQTVLGAVLEGTLENPEDFVGESEAKAMLASLGFF